MLKTVGNLNMNNGNSKDDSLTFKDSLGGRRNEAKKMRNYRHSRPEDDGMTFMSIIKVQLKTRQ